MRSLLHVELDKALRNRWFSIAVATASALACASAALSIAGQLGWTLTLNADEWTGMGASGAFASWIVVGAGDMYASGIFFMLMPLLASVPYAWSLRTEMVDGGIIQQLIRASRTKVLLARYVAVFVSAGLVVALPLLLNFVILLCFVPATVPESAAYLYLGISEQEIWADLLFSYPLAYVACNVVWDFVLCGLWGGFVLGMSLYIDNRVTLLAGSFLLCLALRLINANVFSFTGVAGFRFNIMELLCAGTQGYIRTGVPMVVVASLLAVASVLLFGLRAGSDQL